jgi:hypothetical protein
VIKGDGILGVEGEIEVRVEGEEGSEVVVVAAGPF